VVDRVYKVYYEGCAPWSIVCEIESTMGCAVDKVYHHEGCARCSVLWL